MKKFLIAAVVFLVYILTPALITMFVTGVTEQNVTQENVYGPRVNVKYKNASKSVEVNEFVTMVLADRFETTDEAEVLRAMAIMIRTDIYRIMGEEMSVDSENLGMDYMTVSNMKNEWGKNYEEYYNLIHDSVTSTGQMVITYNGNPIDAKYTRVCNEKTMSGSEVLGEEYAYLAQTDCPDDLTSSDFLKVVTITAKEFVKKINNAFEDSGIDEDNPAADIQVVSKRENGYVEKLQVGNVLMTGETFAKILELNSPFFTIESDNNDVKITTKGKGSGFGVSLYTANNMARSGSTYEEIIQKFYSGVSIVSR